MGPVLEMDRRNESASWLGRFFAGQVLRLLSIDRNKQATGAAIIIDFNEIGHKAPGETSVIGGVVAETLRVGDRHYWQGVELAVPPNRLFQRVVAIVVAVAGEQQQPFSLAHMPDYVVRSIAGQVYCSETQHFEAKIQPPCGPFAAFEFTFDKVEEIFADMVVEQDAAKPGHGHAGRSCRRCRLISSNLARDSNIFALISGELPRRQRSTILAYSASTSARCASI